MSSLSDRFVCKHCIGEKSNAVQKAVESRKNAEAYTREFERLQQNLYPYIVPDADLIELAAKACSGRKLGRLRHLRQMSETIYQIRTAQAFDSPILVDGSELADLPVKITRDTDEAIEITHELRELTAKGLGLNIPMDMPVEAYLEIVQDYQPTISAALNVALGGPEGAISQVSIGHVARNIGEINNEIERIKGLKRYVVLEASLGFYRNHRPLVTATLVAGAMGLAGSLTGCAAVVAAASGIRIAKRRGWLKDNQAAQRLGRMVSRDLQPHLAKVLAAYVGGDLPAINVLSLRKRIGAE